MPKKRVRRKRQTQRLFNQILESHQELYTGLKGEVIMLPGTWDPQMAVRMYDGIATRVHALEHDFSSFQKVRNKIDHWPKVVTSCCDIFEVTLDRLSEEDCPVRGVDYDLCQTYTDQIHSNVLRDVDLVMLNDSIPCFWFRLTFCMRSGMKNAGHYAQGYLRELYDYMDEDTSGKIVAWNDTTYKDGMPMHTVQCIWIRLPKGTNMTTKRTLKELNDAEQDMVRTLIEDVVIRGDNATYNEQDIARRFDLTPRAVSAIKAHVTMGHYEN